MNGWIKLSRNIVNHWIWQDSDRLKWWIDLLLLASYEKRKKFLKQEGIIIELQPGQTEASYSFLAERWGVSKWVVRKFIELLEADGMVTHKAYRKYAIITICNYERYQEKDAEQCTSDYTSESTSGFTSECTQVKNIKNIRNEEVKENKEKNISPSLRSGDSSDLQSNSQDEPLNEESFIKFFNQEMEDNNAIIPKIYSMGKTRKTHLRARFREHGLAALEQMVRKAAQSDFLNGKNTRGWKATFDWLILPDNFTKVVEGSYENIAIQSNSYPNYSNIQKDRYALRRGVEPAATGPEDYTDTI